MKDKIILITGASGEIGLNLISHLSKNTNKKIIALDLKKYKKNLKIFKFIKGSILDKKLLSDISKKYIIEDIYHLAAILSTKAETNPQLARDVNINGTLNIFQIGLYQNLNNKIITKIFFPSSIAVYHITKKNEDKKKRIKENMFCNPKTVYGQQKLFCENIGSAIAKYGNETKLKIDFRCIRFPGIISTNSIPTGGTSDYAPEMIHNAFKQKEYRCFVNKNSCLPFIVMPDAINAISSLMARPLSPIIFLTTKSIA